MKTISGEIMFNGYSIKKKNNEELLYLYMDFSYEFAGKRKKNIGFIDRIIDYINVNKIPFNGKKIVIVIGGLVLGTFFLTEVVTNISTFDSNKITYVDKIFLNSYNDKNEIVDITAIEKEIDEEKLVINSDEFEVDDDVIKDNSPPISGDTAMDKKNTNNSNDVTSNKNSSNKNSNTTSGANNNSTVNKEVQDSTPVKPVETPPVVVLPSENKTYVTVHRSNGAVLQIELEEYVIGVVGAEMPASFNSEALKVQAILARTYALKSIEIGRKLTDTVSTQAYKDSGQLQALWGSSYNTYYNKIKSAVDATKGKRIVYAGKLIDALYFSCSNGYTENAVNVWGNSIPYLQSVKNDWDTTSSAYLRETVFSYEQLSNMLGIQFDVTTVFGINNRNESNRVTNVVFGDKSYSGIELRTVLSLRSADFDIEITDNGLKFVTKGFGHGVGVSQYGANSMANAGYDYSSIINYYYMGVNIVS